MDGRWLILCWCGGVVLATFSPRPGVMLLGVACLLPVLLLAGSVLSVLRTWPFRIILAALLGAGWHGWWAQTHLDAQLPAQMEGEDVTVSGYISSLPAASGAGRRFEFTVTGGSASLIGRRLLLTDYDGPPLRGGDFWQWTVRLKRPHGQANPGGLDGEARLFQRRIVARGYVRPGARTTLPGGALPSLTSLRQGVKDVIGKLPGERRRQAVLLALILGDRSELTKAHWDSFTRTGTNHLFVISGLHVGLVSLCSYVLVGTIWRVLNLPVRRLPRQQAAAILAVAVALLYALLAGFTLSTQRAFVMLAVFMSGHLTRRPVSLPARYCLALAVVLLLNPLAVTAAGFWLSFSAVAGLAFFLPDNRRMTPGEDKGVRYYLKYYSAPQFVVFVVLLAPLLMWTGRVSLLAPLVNIAAIPIVGMLVVPVALASTLLAPLSPTVAAMGLSLADGLLHALLSALEWLARVLSWSQVELFPAGPLVAVLTAVAALLLIMPGRINYRWLVLPLCLPLAWPAVSRPPPGGLRVQVMDVGQGLAVLLLTHRHALLYDTGPGIGEEFDLAATQVVPVLRRQGIGRLDRVLVSHGDSDHAGGLNTVLASFRVAELLGPSALGPPARPCRAGQTWQWDGVLFRVLWPDNEPGPPARRNSRSCVLQILAGEHRVLLPGDIEAGVEKALVRRFGGSLRSTLMLAPHHGSQTSSSYPWLKTVTPRIVVFSAGYRNGFGHPAPAVVARHRELAVTTITTANSGWLGFEFQPGQTAVRPVQWRQAVPRYWRRSDNP